jgi:hypothetical protein
MNKVSNYVEKKNELPNLPSEEEIVDKCQRDSRILQTREQILPQKPYKMALASVEQIRGKEQKFMKFLSTTKYLGVIPNFLLHSEASEKLRTWVKVKKRRPITCNWVMMMFRT